MDINPGNYVLEINERCSDSLDPRYNGPFLVVDNRGSNIKVNRERGSKWIHVGRCKLYKRSGATIVAGNQGGTQDEEVQMGSGEIEHGLMEEVNQPQDPESTLTGTHDVLDEIAPREDIERGAESNTPIPRSSAEIPAT